MRVTIRAKAPYHSMYLGAPWSGPLLDEIEIQHQVQGGDGDHDQAEDDAHRAGPEDQGNAHPEQPQDQGNDVEQGDAAGGRHDAPFETLGGLDQSRFISQQQRQAGARR